MKATGIVRRIDPLGRIVLPKELRKVLNIEEGTPMEIYTTGDSIILKKFETKCCICGNEKVEELKEYTGSKICNCCIDAIKNMPRSK